MWFNCMQVQRRRHRRSSAISIHTVLTPAPMISFLAEVQLQVAINIPPYCKLPLRFVGFMSAGRTLFVLALLWRHRIRYAFERFLWTGQVDEGVARTLRANTISLSTGKVEPLPRAVSDVSLTTPTANTSTKSTSTSSLASTVVVEGGSSSDVVFVAPPSPRVATAIAYDQIPPIDTNLANGLPSAPTKSASAPSRDRVYPYPTCKLGYRLCGCAEIDPCIHKEGSKFLPSYDDAYLAWRTRTDMKSAVATALWFLGRQSSNPSVRLGAAVGVQLSASALPQLVVLYKLATMLETKMSPTQKLLLRSVTCFIINQCASHESVSFGHAMAAAGKQFKFPSLPMLVSDGTDATKDYPVAPSIQDIMSQMWKDTPGVTFKLLRFYAILFLVIRPLVRMKNPFRRGGLGPLTDLAGAVLSVSLARYSLAISSLWRTSNPNHVGLMQVLRLATCVPLVLSEHYVVKWLLPNNAGSALFHAFILANAILSLGAGVFGYDVWRRICCGADALMGKSGTSASVLGLA